MGVAVGAQAAPGGMAERAVPGEGPVLDLPDQHRVDPPNLAATRTAPGPAPSPGELTVERRPGPLQLAKPLQQPVAGGVGEPGPDVADVDELPGVVVGGEQQLSSAPIELYRFPAPADQPAMMTSWACRIAVLIQLRERRPG